MSIPCLAAWAAVLLLLPLHLLLRATEAPSAQQLWLLQP